MFDCLSLYISLLFFLSLSIHLSSTLSLLFSLLYYLSSIVYLLLSIFYYLSVVYNYILLSIFCYVSIFCYLHLSISVVCNLSVNISCAHYFVNWASPVPPSVSKSHSGFECFVSSVETLRRTDVNDVSTLTKMSIATHHNIAGGGVWFWKIKWRIEIVPKSDETTFPKIIVRFFQKYLIMWKKGSARFWSF